jgi:hypothetical protein
VKDLVYNVNYSLVEKKDLMLNDFKLQIKRKHEVKKFQDSLCDLRETSNDIGKKLRKIVVPILQRQQSRRLETMD